MGTPRRLIEVDLPIQRISEHARKEKSSRAGLISRLHIWWARKPLAACRAVLCAALWPDPADPRCPEAFRKVATDEMRRWLLDHATLLGEKGQQRALQIRKDARYLADVDVLRDTLLDFVADVANPVNASDSKFLETARRLTRAARVIDYGPAGQPLVVADPFAGGGSIPLEALRLDAEAFASDLNPVAVLLNRVLLEQIPRFGERLAQKVRRWGAWLVGRAQAELESYYPPDPDGSVPVAYLWVRWIKCEGPRCGVEVPLRHTFWLAQTKKRRIGLTLVRDNAQRCVRFDIREGPSEGEVAAGTIRRASVTCPLCGFTTPADSVWRQIHARRGSTDDAKLLCVVVRNSNGAGYSYRLPIDADVLPTRRAVQQLSKLPQMGGCESVPDEPLPSKDTRAFPAQRYGMERWGDLFSPRQRLVMVTLARLIREIGDKMVAERSEPPELIKAVCSVLSLAVDKQADFGNAMNRWAAGSEDTKQLFARPAIPMMWDFSEANPLDSTDGTFPRFVEALSNTLESLGSNWKPGQAALASAVQHPLPDASVDCIFTDPPYYDAIPYADLTDFFYVWLKRMLGDFHPDLFHDRLTPKETECRIDPPRGKNQAYFEGIMRDSMRECRRILRPDGIAVVVFAHKSTSGWEAQLQAMVDAGWTITGSWPIDTELGSRLRAMNSAVLSSSIHLVCRPREHVGGGETVGDWRKVLGDLTARVHAWMPRLAGEGVVGADAIFACLGPAMEVFSRYDHVEKANGDPVAMKEFLEHVWSAVSREALDMIFQGADASGFEEDARLTAMWLWTLSSVMDGGTVGPADDEDDSEEESAANGRGSGFFLEYDAARKIAQGLGAHLEQLVQVAQIQGKSARLLAVSERARFLLGNGAPGGNGSKRKGARQLDLFEPSSAAETHKTDAPVPEPGLTVLDRVHQGMLLFAGGRADGLKRFLVEEGVGREARFWGLAQALSALYPTRSEEKRWVDGILARKRGLGL